MFKWQGLNKTVNGWPESEGATWESKMWQKPRNESGLICICEKQS